MFNVITNGICYLLIYILYSWDKIYYILNSRGDNPETYFNSIRREECLLHKSYYCGCIKSDTEYEIVQKYLEFYKLCSKVIIYSSDTGLRIIRRNNLSEPNSQKSSSLISI